jgi:hypothetical protein
LAPAERYRVPLIPLDDYADAPATAVRRVHSRIMTSPTPTGADAGPSRFRQTLVRVMAVQIVTLIALWLIQRHFTV